MAHAQLDDLYGDHPKVVGLSDAAFRLHTLGILHCARHLTDGRIEAPEVPRLARRFRRSALAELLENGLWTHVFDADYYEIHDYLDWNPSRAEVRRRRELATKRQAEWRANRAQQH